MLCFILCFLLLGFAHSQNVSDLCSETNKLYWPFTYPHKRIYTNEETGLSDRFVKEGWFGIKGFIIPHFPPEVNHCGTSFPIYLRERPPTSGNIEDVTACVQANSDCEIEIQIKALVCSSSLTVYRLSRVPLDDASYCLAPSVVSEFPDFKANPEILYTLQQQNSLRVSKEYRFNCHFKESENEILEYKAEWFVDDISVYESDLTSYDNNDTRALTDTKLEAAGITTAGFQLHCAIQAGYTRNHVAGLPSRSKKMFIGMLIQNQVIVINEGEEAKISVKPSLEIGCSNTKRCNMTVSVVIPETSVCLPTASVTDKGCGTQISSPKWYDIGVSASVTLDRENKDILKTIYLRTPMNYPNHNLWANYTLPPVKIHIRKNTDDIEGRLCKFTNDPYLRDFKNRMLRFEMPGIFILFKSGNVEIQVQVTKCDVYSSGYCVCGAVVRVGRTAFMINHCNLGYWFIDYILCDDGGEILNVKTKELMFYTLLPSGTQVTLTPNSKDTYYWMHIEIIPSVRDYERTSGLCNKLDSSDVLTFNTLWWSNRERLETDETFFKKWKLSLIDNSNLFVPKNLKSVEKWDSSGTFQHCTCTEVGGKLTNSIDCSLLPRTQDCFVDDDYKLFHRKRCVSPQRKKRSVPEVKNGHIHHRKKRDVSWKNGWTAERADEYCTGLFNNSAAIEWCDGIKGLDIGGSVQACITDIQYSGSDVFALAALSTVSAQCINEARMNRTLREENVEEDKSFLEVVKEVSCPSECSDKGRCEKGKCICNSGYIGSDCSLKRNLPPLAHNLESDGYCDLSEDDCTEVAVFGGRFADDDETKCRLFSFEIENGQITVSRDPEIHTAVFESIGEVTCKLPSGKRQRRSVEGPVIDETVRGYTVSVSNNGENYSQQLNFIIYNTECINCIIDNGNTVTCSFSPNHCIMDNMCYGNGTLYNNGDKEYVCRADMNDKIWLSVVNGTVMEENNNSKQPTTNTKPRMTDVETDYVIIGISVTAATVFIVVCVFIFYCTWKKTRKASRRPSVIQPSTNPTYDSKDI